MRFVQKYSPQLTALAVLSLMILSVGFASLPATGQPESQPSDPQEVDPHWLLRPGAPEPDPDWLLRSNGGRAPGTGLDPVLKTGTIKGVLDSLFARRYQAVVYVDEIEGKRFDPPTTNPLMDQVNLMFKPHVLPVLVGSTVDFPNNDEVRHNVYTTKSSACQFNLGTYASGESKQVTCTEPGVITLLCNTHAEMSGYIVVVPTPYFATTDNKGEFAITGVPGGTYRLTFWHERLAPQTLEITVEPDAETYAEFSDLKRK